MISRAAWLCSKKFAGDESRSIPSVDHPGDGRGMICIRKTKSPASPAGTAGSYGGIFVRISFSTRSHPGLAGCEFDSLVFKNGDGWERDDPGLRFHNCTSIGLPAKARTGSRTAPRFILGFTQSWPPGFPTAPAAVSVAHRPVLRTQLEIA